MGKTRSTKNSLSSEKVTNAAALSFIAAGVACYAFSLIDNLGILDQLNKDNRLSIRVLRSFPNPLVLQSAFETLEANDVVLYRDGFFHLTELGKALYKHRGSIGLIYEGYRNVLSHQLQIARDEPSHNWSLVDSPAVSQASVNFGDQTINHLILNTVMDSPFRGLCDLGCGEANRLKFLCRKMKMRGYGFDLTEASIQKAKKTLRRNDRITLLVKDITKIDKQYLNVQVLLQSFVFHDLAESVLLDTLKSFRFTFPNLKMFIYIDAFAPDEHSSIQLPGFDYIHSLLNIKTRTKKDTLALIKKAGFYLDKEYEIPGLPNCCFWILIPKTPQINDTNG